jgi:hypothetical protein
VLSRFWIWIRKLNFFPLFIKFFFGPHLSLLSLSFLFSILLCFSSFLCCCLLVLCCLELLPRHLILLPRLVATLHCLITALHYFVVTLSLCHCLLALLLPCRFVVASSPPHCLIVSSPSWPHCLVASLPRCLVVALLPHHCSSLLCHSSSLPYCFTALSLLCCPTSLGRSIF